MENKDKEQSTPSSHINNSIHISGGNSGIVGHTVNISNPKPPAAETPHAPVETSLLKSRVVQLVMDSQIEEALGEILKTKPPEEVQKNIILLAGRFSQLKIEKIAGSIDKEMQIMELNRIRDGILTLVSKF